MEIASGEFEDSVIVDDGEVALVVVVELDGGDFIFSNSKLYAAAPPPLLKHADISSPMLKTKKNSVKLHCNTDYVSLVYEIEGNEIKNLR